MNGSFPICSKSVPEKKNDELTSIKLPQLQQFNLNYFRT